MIRGLGVFLVVVGISLLAFMSWLSLWMYNAIAHSGTSAAGSRFNGGPKDVAFIVFVCGLVMLIGLAATVAGSWQIIFGRQNKLIVAAVVVLGLIFLGTGMAVSFME